MSIFCFLSHNNVAAHTACSATYLRCRKPQHRQKLLLLNDLDAAALPYVSLCKEPFIGLATNNRILSVVAHHKIVGFLGYILLRNPSPATDQLKCFLPLIKQETSRYGDTLPFNLRLLGCIHDAIPVLDH